MDQMQNTTVRLVCVQRQFRHRKLGTLMMQCIFHPAIPSKATTRVTELPLGKYSVACIWCSLQLSSRNAGNGISNNRVAQTVFVDLPM